MNKEHEEGAETQHDVTSASLRKLLSSHLSIYNALTNPELDINLPNSPARDRLTPPPLDFPVATLEPLLSWLPINVNTGTMPDLASRIHNSSVSPRPLSASILSNTSDEDNHSDSMVIVPSLTIVTGSKVMVFETDEEDDGDEYTYVRSGRSVYSVPQFGDEEKTLTSNSNNANKHIAPPSNLHSLFIMPKMSLSENGKQVQLTILSTCNDALKMETQALIDFIKNNVDVLLKVRVNHLVIAQSPLKFDMSLVKSSSLLFLVNDGSLLFIEFMDALLRCDREDLLPKLTVINIMTTNYFINLFEIIHSTRPHQIWKTPSLRNSKLLCKMKSYIDEELSDGTIGKHAQAFKARSRKFNMKHRKTDCSDFKKHSSSVYDSLKPTRKPDYKYIEKQIRSEMLMSLSYAHIDPLQLSSNLNHMRALLGAFKNFFDSGSSSPSCPSPDENDDLNILRRNMWLICSFSIGIGMGVTVASGAVAFLGKSLSDFSKSLLPVKSDIVGSCQQFVATEGSARNFSTSEMADNLLGVMEVFKGSINNVSKTAVDSLVLLVDNSVVNLIIEYLSFAIKELKYISALTTQSVLGGFNKSSNILMAMVC